MSMIALQNFNPDLRDLAFYSLGLGVEALTSQNGARISPFAICDWGSKRSKDWHSIDMDKMRKAVSISCKQVTGYALVFDGIVTLKGDRFDGVIVEAAERGFEEGIVLTQLFNAKTATSDVELIGKPMFISTCKNLLPNIPCTETTLY